MKDSKHTLEGLVRIKKAKMGEKNPRWNGGISKYPNHAEMKRNRLIKLQETQGKCEICGEPAYCVHHLDEDKSNQSLDNLVALCHKCHMILHNAENKINKTSKYIRLYGMSLQEMSNRFGGSPSRYMYLHRKGLLKQYLEQKAGN